MKLLKLIPAAAIALTAFTTFEAKAGYPSGWTKKNSCIGSSNNIKWYKLQKTDTPASYGVYNGDYTTSDDGWLIENVSYNCATKWYKYKCNETVIKPSCS